MQGDAAIDRAGNVDVHAVLEQLVFVQGGPQVRSDDVPAVPADAGGGQALVRVSDELRPEVGVCGVMWSAAAAPMVRAILPASSSA